MSQISKVERIFWSLNFSLRQKSHISVLKHLPVSYQCWLFDFYFFTVGEERHLLWYQPLWLNHDTGWQQEGQFVSCWFRMWRQSVAGEQMWSAEMGRPGFSHSAALRVRPAFFLQGRCCSVCYPAPTPLGWVLSCRCAKTPRQLTERLLFGSWFQRDQSSSWWEVWQQAAWQQNREAESSCLPWQAGTRETWLPLMCLLQQGRTAWTSPNMAANWGPSAPITKSWGTFLIQTTIPAFQIHMMIL